MRSALRWASLIGAAAVLYIAGARRLHLHDFWVFLVLVVVLSVAVVAVFLSARDDGRAETRVPFDGE